MRAPVTGVVSEALLAVGPLAAEVALAVLYAFSVLCWWRVARKVGASSGIAMAAVLLAYPGYVLLFHRLASDVLYAAAFALAALLVARLVESRTPARAAAVGVALALLVLVRPVSQILIVLAPLLLLDRGAWRPRIGVLASFGAAAAVPLLLSGRPQRRARRRLHGRARRGSRPAALPRVRRRPDRLAAERRASRRARSRRPGRPARARAVPFLRHRPGHLLFRRQRAHARGPHRTLRSTWGWSDDYAHLARVGREAVRAHPGDYARGVGRDSWRLLWWPVFSGRGLRGSGRETARRSGAAARADRGAADPVGQRVGVHLDARRPLPGGLVVADGAPDRVRRPGRRGPSRPYEPSCRGAVRAALRPCGSMALGTWLDRASRWFPRSVLRLALGLVAIAARRPRRLATPLVFTAAALLVILGTSLAVPAAAEYSAPVAPAFLCSRPVVCGTAHGWPS